VTGTADTRRGLTRSQLIKRAGVAAAVVAVNGVRAPYAFAGPLKYAGRTLKGNLSVVQWTHFVPKYDAWLGTWAKTWGEKNDVQVDIDHVPYTRLPALAATEAKAKRGHDIFGFLSSPARYEDQLIDHTAVVTQIEHEIGPYGDLGRRSTYNARTNRYFGVSDSFVPAPLIWRHDLWNSIGESPASWDHVRAAAPALKGLGHPIGIGQANEPDSTTALCAFLMSFGSFVQDESNHLTLDRPATVEAVRFMADLYASGEENAIFGWDAASNNEYLLGGKGSLVVNAISAIRRAEDLGMPFAKDLWIWPVPSGPSGRLGLPQYTSVYSIWKSSKNIGPAQRFLADLCIDSGQAVLASKLFGFPSFAGAVPLKKLYKAAAADVHPPRGKYTILTTVANEFTHNVGYPGHANAAIQEVFETSLIPQMFARVSLGKMSAEDSVRATAQQMKSIWARWRAAGKV